MSRSIFGGTTSDFVVTLGPSGELHAVPARVTFWTEQTGGTQVTDLLLDDEPVTSILVPAGGQIPAFEGPDFFTELWVDAGHGYRALLVAQGKQGPAGPSGGPFPNLDGVAARQIPITLGDNAVEFADLSETISAETDPVFARLDAVPAYFQTYFETLASGFASGGIALHPASGYLLAFPDEEGYNALGITTEGDIKIARTLLADGVVGFDALADEVKTYLPVPLHPASGYLWAFLDREGYVGFGQLLDGEVKGPGLQASSVEDGSITLAKLAPDVTERLGRDDSLPDTYYVETVGSTPTRSLYSNSTRYGRRVLLTATGDPHDPVAADGRVVYTTTSGLRWQPGDGSKPPGPMQPAPVQLNVSGDSFTAAQSHSADNLAAALPGVTCVSLGEAGTSPQEIAIKFGAVEPIITLPGNVLPTGTGPVTATVLDPVTGYKDVQNEGGSAYVGEIECVDGTWVAGTLTRPYPAPVEYPELHFEFARTAGGTAKALDPAGARFRSTVGPAAWGKHQVWWFGRNMLAEFGETEYGPLAMMKLMSQKLTAYAPRLVVLSITNHPLTGGGERLSNPAAYDRLMRVNAGLQSEFGPAFIDVRRRLIDEGLDAIAAFDPTGAANGDWTVTPEDEADIADDMVPATLRLDSNNVHLKPKVWELVYGSWVADYMTETMGWF